MVGVWKEVRRILIAAQVSAVGGAFLLPVAMLFAPGSTVVPTFGLFVYILVFALPVINAVALGIVLPLQMKLRLEMSVFRWCLVASLAGSVIYLLMNVILSIPQEMPLGLSQTAALVFPLLVGALFGLIFGFSYGIQKPSRWT